MPTLNLGHEKKQDERNLKQASQRGQRASEKERKRKEQQERERALAKNLKQMNPGVKFVIFFFLKTKL